METNPQSHNGFEKAQRDEHGRFLSRGGPGGRGKQPKAAEILLASEAYRVCRKLLSDGLPEVFAKMLELAKNGDVQAAKLLIDRAWPSSVDPTFLADLEASLEAAVEVLEHGNEAPSHPQAA